jgi:hypothetical protein
MCDVRIYLYWMKNIRINVNGTLQSGVCQSLGTIDNYQTNSANENTINCSMKFRFETLNDHSQGIMFHMPN